MRNDEVLKSSQINFENSVEQDVNLSLEQAVEVSATDEFYIAISQEGENQFVFDTMLFFLSEE